MHGLAFVRSCALHALAALFEAAQSGFGVGLLVALQLV
jgi:hypothetical protein